MALSLFPHVSRFDELKNVIYRRLERRIIHLDFLIL